MNIVSISNGKTVREPNKVLTDLLFTVAVFLSLIQAPNASGAEISSKIVADTIGFSPTGTITADALVYSRFGSMINVLVDGDGERLDDEIFFKLLNRSFSPTFGFRDEPRPLVERTVSSESPDRNAFATSKFAFARSGYQPPGSDPSESRFIVFGEAATFQDSPPTVLPSGSAGQVGVYLPFWPREITSGEFDYSPTISEIRLKINDETTSPSDFEFAGVEIFGEKAEIPEVDEDAAFTAIWTLTVSAARVLSSPSDLTITFESPLLNLDTTDDEIAEAVRDAFTIIDGEARLENFVLFNSTLKVSEPILFGEGMVGVAQTLNIDPFKCYVGKQFLPFSEDNPRLPFPSIARVTLNDQFASRETDVRFLKGLCNPAGKNAPVDTARADHLSCYTITDAHGQPPFFPPRRVTIETDNFGEDTARLGHAFELCVSASKNGEGEIAGPAFKCYNARSAQRDFPDITLDDQFFRDEPARIKRLSRLCTPVGIDAPAPPELSNTFDHLACYDIDRRILHPFIKVDLLDRFIEDAVGQDITFTTALKHRFCEPARKLPVEDEFFATPK